jgi:hypothetical protein
MTLLASWERRYDRARMDEGSENLDQGSTFFPPAHVRIPASEPTVTSHFGAMPIDPDGMHVHPMLDMHMYSDATIEDTHAVPTVRLKRPQVKNACTNCQKSRKNCDDARPCSRCVKNKCASQCVSSPRKSRRKGTKQTPHMKRMEYSRGFLSLSFRRCAMELMICV